MARVQIVRRKFSISAQIYNPKTGRWSVEEFYATGRASMNVAEREFNRWCWSQGIIGRVVSMEDISHEPDQIERPA